MNVDNRIVKASFRNCPLSDRKIFPQSTCIMPISVGQSIHEGKKFLATIKLINQAFKACTILVDDSVQRHTLKIDNDVSDEDLYQMAVQAGNQWLARNATTYHQLTIPHNIMRWDDWLKRPSFQSNYEKVIACYASNENYRAAIQKNIAEFLSRYLQRIEKSIDYSKATDLCLDYLLEECAVMCLWVEGQYNFEVYPSGRNQAMAATHQYLIEPSYPHYLKSVALRFKKYPSLTTSNIEQLENSFA